MLTVRRVEVIYSLYTSAYANFSMEVMPQGSVNITGILLRYNNQWEVVVRTLSDIKRNN